MDLDLVVENGWIADGMLPTVFKGTIGVLDDKIAFVREGRPRLSGKRVIDAEERIVAPGFVDVHSHADHFLLLEPAMKNKLMQGVTTEVGGNCGSSAYPWNDAHLFHLSEMEGDFAWNSFAGFSEALERRGIGLNFASLIGLDSLRREAVKERAPDDADVKRLRRLFAAALEEGALGLSIGAGIRALSPQELRALPELCRLAQKSGGVLATHLCSEASEILDALSDTISIAAESGVSLQISHFKTLDRFNWHKQEVALDLIGTVRAAGLDVGLDCFPYTACCSPLRVFMPPRLAAYGAAFSERAESSAARDEIEDYLAMHFPDPESYSGIMCPHLETARYRDLSGMDLLTAAATAGVEPGALAIDLTLAEGLDRFVYYDCICKNNMDAAIGLEFAMVASDSFPTDNPKYFRNSIMHPRTFGAFPEFLSEFVYASHTFDLPTAIKKITSIPAKKFGLRGRGVLGSGAFADITIFEPERLRAGASLDSPCTAPSGIDYVIVNGRVAIERGEFKEVYAGRVLRGEG